MRYFICCWGLNETALKAFFLLSLELVPFHNMEGLSLSGLCSEAMSLSCLACNGVNSPAESFRSYSSSESDGEGRCGAIINCWSRKAHELTPAEVTNNIMNSRVAPQPAVTSESPPGSPRLVRCRAVRRDTFRDWHIGEMTDEVRLWE